MTVSLRTTLLVDDVLAGLSAPRKHLPCRLLYDAEGVALFESITRLDDYYPTSTELELLDQHALQIARQVGPEARVIEPGAGDVLKTRRLLRAPERPSAYVAIDVAHDQLARVTATLRAELPAVDVQGVVAEYAQPFALPALQHAWRRTLVFFPAGGIGRFEPRDARAVLAMLRRIAGDDGLLLLGADSTRDASVLARAYDDPHGRTAELHQHVLRRLNRERGTNFELEAFEFRAVWNAEASRVEMQLASTKRQSVRIDGHTFTLAAGEPIVTEQSYKHSPMAVQAMLSVAGWRPRQVFTSTRHPYRLWLCEAVTWARGV